MYTLLLALAFNPTTEPVQRVDVIQLSHVYNSQGERYLTQYIFWKGGVIRAFENSNCAGPLTYMNGVYRVKSGNVYVESTTLVESWSGTDPELVWRNENADLFGLNGYMSYYNAFKFVYIADKLLY